MVEEAITYTKQALQYDPYCINAHYVLGAAYEKKGSKQEARAEYELVIKLDYATSPNNGARDFEVRRWAQAALARLKRGIAMNILPADTILENRYRILGLLGQGGMSRVYLAEDTRLGVRVAIKENLQTNLEAQTQFEREVQILARLSHPNLPRVIDHFVDTKTGRQYLVMDYIEGEDLEAMLKRTGPLPEATTLAWLRQILDALEYLHRQQPPIIHRDVKPGNIKITPEGKAILVDFGIAKVYDPRQATLTGARAVTPGYAPPEQYSLRTTERSDIYALGATLYTMLTGRVPPEAPLRTSGEEALVPPSQIVPGKISQATEQAILRAMDVETDKRWQNVAQLRTALERRGVPPPLPVPSKFAVPTPPTLPVEKPIEAQRTPTTGGIKPIWIGSAIGTLILLTCVMVAVTQASRACQPVPTPTPPRTATLQSKTVEPTKPPEPTKTATAKPTNTLITTRVPTARPTDTPTPPPFGGGTGKIAFECDLDGKWEICVINVDGSGLRSLTNNQAGDNTPAWSPDGLRIAFASDRDGNWEIYVMNADGGELRQLTNTNSPTDNRYPTWSPDGQHIAFESDRDGNYEIYVMNADGSGLRRLTNNQTRDRIPDWSPDGRQIAFISDRDGNWEIYVMNADGSSLRRLTNNPATDEIPAWSPDSQQIAFVSDRDGNWEIYVMNANGSSLRRLTNSPTGDWDPAWSPDGQYIAFESERKDNNYEIYVMNADGSNVTRVTNNPLKDRRPVWQPASKF